MNVNISIVIECFVWMLEFGCNIMCRMYVCMFLTRCHEFMFPATKGHLPRRATFAPSRRWPFVAGTTVTLILFLSLSFIPVLMKIVIWLHRAILSMLAHDWEICTDWLLHNHSGFLCYTYNKLAKFLPELFVTHHLLTLYHRALTFLDISEQYWGQTQRKIKSKTLKWLIFTILNNRFKIAITPQ